MKRIWKEDGGASETWMFDLANDPYERRNIFEATPDQARDLLDLIRKEQELDDSSKRTDVGDRMGP